LYLAYSVLSEISFIPKDLRAQIFELSDNEIPVFRIALPDNEFATLKEKASITEGYEYIDLVNKSIKKFVETINSQNFTELFPGSDFKKLLPELKLNKNGHPSIDYRKYIVVNDDFETSHDNYNIIFNVFNSKSYLNLVEVLYVLSGLNISSKEDEDFMDLLYVFGKENVSIDEDGNFTFGDENLDGKFTEIPTGDSSVFIGHEDYTEIPEESTDYFEALLDNEKFNEFDEDIDFEDEEDEDEDEEDENEEDFKKKLEEEGPTLDLNSFTTKDLITYLNNYNFNKNFNFTDGVLETDFKTKNATLKVEINR